MASSEHAFRNFSTNRGDSDFEIRDNTGRVTGYVRPNDGIGGYEVDDAAGRSKGFLLPDAAIGGYRFEPLRPKRR